MDLGIPEETGGLCVESSDCAESPAGAESLSLITVNYPGINKIFLCSSRLVLTLTRRRNFAVVMVTSWDHTVYLQWRCTGLLLQLLK